MEKRPKESVPFKLNITVRNSRLQKPLLMIKGLVERFFYFDRLNELYVRSIQDESDRRPYPDVLLDCMNLRYEVDEGDLARIPKTGPVVVVANHPFGGIEGIVLAAVLRSIRPDARIMANYLLAGIEAFREYFIFVDPFGGKKSKTANLKPMKECILWLKNGGMLAAFPSGEVSHFDLKTMQIHDPAWSTTVARLIRRANAPVTPIFFQGCNGPLFQIAGLMHPRFRTAMLPYEIINKQGGTIALRVGQTIPWERLSRLENDRDLMDYLSFRTYILAGRDFKERPSVAQWFRSKFRRKKATEPICEPFPQEEIEKEALSLPPEQQLLATEEYRVFFARTAQIPTLLNEIGRLREITFREANEGTGQALDLDSFDRYYLHMFLWSNPRREVVGAYRLGQADLILPQWGVKGLYTNTLFKYRKSLLDQLNPALEMGRSFIRPEYQRNFSALLLLWKGIGAYIARHPRYINLFGPVSINNEYNSVSRELLVKFLQDSKYDHDLARLIKPRKPLRSRAIRPADLQTFSRVVADVEDVAGMIGDIEKDQKGIPILLKQYLKLGGRLLAFNIDPSFSFVLDGLICVDIRKTDPRTMFKYMGKQGMDNFLRYHGKLSSPPPGGDGSE